VYRALHLLGGLLWAAAALGQPQPAPPVKDPLTLSEAIALALKQSPSLEIARQSARAAQAAFVQTKSQLYPQAIASANYTGTQSRARTTSFGGTIRTTGGTTYFRDYQTALSYTAYQTGLHDQVRQAKEGAHAATHDSENARRELILTVSQDYYTLLASRRLEQVAEETLHTAEQNVTLLEARVEQGSAAPVDVLPVKTSLARAKAALITAQTGVRVAVASLRKVLGLPLGEDLRVVDVLAEKPVKLDLKQSLAEALLRRPDYRAATARVTAARAALSIARAERWPTLSVTSSVAEDWFDDQPARIWEFVGQASYPLFDAGKSKAAVTQADANYRVALSTREDLELQIALDVEQAYVGVQNGGEEIAAAEAAVTEATANLEAARAKMMEGVAIAIEVSTAEDTLAQTKADYVQAVYDYNMALAQLKAARGE